MEQKDADLIKLKKLPRSWRLANKYYKIILILMVFVNSILCAVNAHSNNVPPLYFEIYSVAISGIPVVWSKILDEAKTYNDMLTPEPSPNGSTLELLPNDKGNSERVNSSSHDDSN